MLRYAEVEGHRHLPFPKGRGICPECLRPVIAKCGEINTHHWAHVDRDDCDSWSEPMGAWHLWWQALVRDEFREVPRGPHRADMVGNGGVVVELQNSPISTEDIRAREAHYGNMVWLFNATDRFGQLVSGTRSFFALGQTKHLEQCTKPVFLDFGDTIVEVNCFSDAITRVSGFGNAMSRTWFAKAFLSDVASINGDPSERFIPTGKTSDPWERKSPVWKLKFPTRWIDPITGAVTTYPKWTKYLEVSYEHWVVGASQNKWHDFEVVIDRHPDIACGWTKDGMRRMKDFFFGKPIILGGHLRLLPSPAKSIPVNRSISATEHVLQAALVHERAGRLPILQDSTRAVLLDKAKAFEIATYGRTVSRRSGMEKPQEPKSLFE